MRREATLSSNNLHRFDLIRAVEVRCDCRYCFEATRYAVTAERGFVLWIGCNPSIADATVDDPTIRRMWGFTMRWMYGQMRVVNVNPHRSTNPKKQQMPDAHAMRINDDYIKAHAAAAAFIICAYGDGADSLLCAHTERLLRGLTRPDKVLMFGRTKKGYPKHPLYLPNNSQVIRLDGFK